MENNSMEVTHIQHDPANDMLLSPVSQRAQSELYQRAPTLMTREVAFSGGEVRVWSPNRMVLWAGAVGSAAAILLLILHSCYFSIPLMLPILTLSVIALRRPCYITTDDQGIGVTTEAGSQALYWEDIQTAQGKEGGGLNLNLQGSIVLMASGEVELRLAGYTKTQQDELLKMVADRAGLEADPRDPLRFVRLHELTAQRHVLTAGKAM